MSMNLDIPALRDPIVSYALASGLFDGVDGHEPKSAPGNGLFAAVWFENLRPFRAGSGLASTSAVLVFNLRIMMPMLTRPEDATDGVLVTAASTVMGALSTDFTFGDQVRNLDMGAESGFLFEARAGYLNMDNKLYRIIDVTIPLIINDVWDEAP